MDGKDEELSRQQTPSLKEEPDAQSVNYDWRFWGVFAGLTLSALLAVLDSTIIATALPTIAAELRGGEEFVWVSNIYFLTSATFQPLFGQFADIWGRRWMMIISVALFVGASAICGAAPNVGTLIVGRGIQGIGGGGITLLIDVIICDIVPLRDRGRILGILVAFISLGGPVGPFLGGVLASTNWRWAFFLNLPIGGITLLVLFFFLQLNHQTDPAAQSIRRIDFTGNGLLVLASVVLLCAFTYAGSKYSWTNPIIIVLLVVGVLSFAIFYFFERSRFCISPVIPPRLFANRTSRAAFFITFIHSILANWVTFFFPVYFQAVLGSTPIFSGVQFLPFTFGVTLFAGVSGALVTKFGEYRLIKIIGLASATAAMGLISLLDNNSTTASWILLQIFVGGALGAVLPAMLPAVQAELTDADTALSTATWACIRSMGFIWGVAIPTAIFNNDVEQLVSTIDDPSVRTQLSRGQAFAHATSGFIGSFNEPIRGQIIQVYVDTLKLVWRVGVIVAATSFLAAFTEKRVELRKDLKTDFGIKGSQEERP